MSEQVFLHEKSVEEQEQAEADEAWAREEAAREAEADAKAYARRVNMERAQMFALSACTQALQALAHDTGPEDAPYVEVARTRVLSALRESFFDPPEPRFGPEFWQTVAESVSQQLPNIMAMATSMQTPPSPRMPPSPLAGIPVGSYRPATHFTATADGQVTPPSDAQKERIREYFEQIAPTLGRLDLVYVQDLLVSEMVKRDQEALARKNRQG